MRTVLAVAAAIMSLLLASTPAAATPASATPATPAAAPPATPAAAPPATPAAATPATPAAATPATPAAATPATPAAATPATPAAATPAAPAAGQADVTVPGPAQAPEWWFDTWNLPALWASGADGRGVTVAVLDTGVQADLPELTGRVLAGANFSGKSVGPSGSSETSPTASSPTASGPTASGPTASGAGNSASGPASIGQVDLDTQPFSHGTAMASLIIARPGSDDIEGAAPGANVLPVVVPLAEETGDPGAPVGSTAQAIRFAADHGAKVISMSFGALRYETTAPDPCPLDLQDAVTYAIRKGALLLAAAGNQGASGSPVTEPGVCLGVISVGSVDEQLQVSSFSSRQPYLTLTAPGEQIATLSRTPGAGFVGFGTSQATALAAAAIADVWSAHPSESNAETLSRVLAAVRDLGTKGHDSSYGYGFIDPSAAAASTTKPTADNPVFAGVQPLLAQTQPKPQPQIKAAGRSDAPLGASSPGPVESPKTTAFWVFCGAAIVLLAVALGLALAARSGRQAAPVGSGQSN